MDRPQAALSSRGGSLDLVAHCGLCATAPRATAGGGASPALASSASRRAVVPGASAPCLFASAPHLGQSGHHPKSLWHIAWSSKRQALASRQTHSRRQIDRMILWYFRLFAL